ncbi:MAG TPA: hypothetical protein ENM97_04690 [Moorella mulderi]|nr:hypothetical protein [Moorella mulderi]
MSPGVILALLGMGLVMAVEVPRLIKRRLYRELAAFSVLMVLSLLIIAQENWGLPLPSITELIEKLFSPISLALKQRLLPQDIMVPGLEWGTLP